MSGRGRRRPSCTALRVVVGPVQTELAIANQATGSSRRRPTLSLKQIRLARGEIAQSRVYIHCDELASMGNSISRGLGEDLCTQKSFIQRLRCWFVYSLSVRGRLRSRWASARRHLQRHESQNARAKTGRLGLSFELSVLRSRSQKVETGFCVRRGRSQ